jgi:amino acid transporter
MVATAIINTFAGLLFLIPIVFVLPDIKEILAVSAAQPMPMIIKNAVGSSAGAFVLLMPLVALGLTCGIGCTTASSRCTWAFARDGAVPGSRWWKQIHPKLHVPLNATLMCMTIEILLSFMYFGSSVVFSAFSGVGVICLTCSYAAPIAISLATRREHLRGAKFNLGRLGYFCNVISIGMVSFQTVVTLYSSRLGWSLLALPLFCMPSTLPVTAASINYAPVVFVAATVISASWYWFWGSTHYKGPIYQDMTQQGQTDGDPEPRT